MLRAALTLVFNLLDALWTALANAAWLVRRPRPPQYVRVTLAGAVPVVARPRLGRRYGERPRSREEFSKLCSELARSEKLEGLVLRLADPHLGLAAVGELREALAGLRAVGKKVIVHADQAGTPEYLLMCVGDLAYLAPAGTLDVTGVRAELLTARAALARAGLAAQVVRRGRYKSAAELVSEEEPSPENREQVGALLDDLYAELVGAIAAGRKLDEARVRAILDEGPFSARAALAAGLVDGLCFEDELARKLGVGKDVRAEKEAGVGPPAALFAALPRPWRWRPLFRPPRVARVPVVGLIKTGKSRGLPIVGAASGAQTVSKALERAAEDRSVRAVVLHVDSRGGSALGSDLIWRAVRRCAEKKPVVAWLEDVAASGGYYVAAACAKIVAAPTCVTGSIGVIGAKLEASGLLARAGARRELIARGRNAGVWSWSRPWTESERAAVEREIGDAYEGFLSRVAEGRGLSRDEVQAVAEGRIWTGRRALASRLVDALGGFSRALAEARALAKIPEGVPLVVADYGPRAAGPLLALRRLLSWKDNGAVLEDLAREVRHLLWWPWDVRV